MVCGRYSPPCHPGSLVELRSASLQIRSMSGEECRESFLVLADVQGLVEDPTHVPKSFRSTASDLGWAATSLRSRGLHRQPILAEVVPVPTCSGLHRPSLRLVALASLSI